VTPHHDAVDLAADPAPAGSAPASRTFALAALMLAMFFAMASNTMVLTGLPQVVSDLDGSPIEYTWIVTTSLLLLTVTTPVWGRLSDTGRHKQLLVTAIAIYVVGTTIAGLAVDPLMIIAARAVIGLGAGGIVTLVQLTITSITDERERPKYFGYLGSVMAVASVSAPALGGIVVDLGGWRWVFFSTLPLAVLALVMVLLFVPRSGATTAPTGRFDSLGAAGILVSSLSLMAWITIVGPGSGWLSGPSLAAVGAVAVLVVACAVIERRAAAPLVPGRLLTHPDLVKILVASVVVGVGSFGATVYFALYFQNVRGLSAGAAGLLLVPMSVATFVMSLVTGRVVSRTGRDLPLLVAAAATIVVGFVPLTILTATTSAWLVAAAGALIGGGLGVLTQQLVATGQRYLAAADIGVGSALILFVRSLATVLCLCVFGVLVDAAVDSADGVEGYVDGIRLVFRIGLVVALAGLVALCRLRPALPKGAEA